MNRFQEAGLSTEVERFVRSLSLVSIDDWVAIRKSTCYPSSPYQYSYGRVHTRMLEATEALSCWQQITTAQIFAIDEVGKLDWERAIADEAKEDEATARLKRAYEDDFDVVEATKAIAGNVVHLAAGVITVMEALTEGEDFAVAFAPFRRSRVELPE